MAKWSEVVNISAFNNLYKEGKINVIALSKIVARRLEKTDLYHNKNEKLIDIINMFDHIDQYGDHGDYCIVLDHLFQFADRGCMLWVESVNPTSSSDMGNKETIDIRSLNKGRYPYPYYDTTSSIVTSLPNAHKPHSTYNPPITTTATTTTSSCEREYSRRPIVSFTPYELNKKLESLGLKESNFSAEMLSYIKSQSTDYQTWLIENCSDYKYVDAKRVSTFN